MKNFGLFKWHPDPRYYRDTPIKVYKSKVVAQKAADAMNARGEHGGNVVVREDISPVHTNPPSNPKPKKAKRKTTKKRARKNPPLWGERTRQVGAKHMIGLRVYEIRYQHAADGKDYKHAFETGVIMWGMPDGSIRVESATGERLWENRDV